MVKEMSLYLQVTVMNNNHFLINKRDKGFRAMIKETYPKMHVLKSIRTDEDAMTIAEEQGIFRKRKIFKRNIYHLRRCKRSRKSVKGTRKRGY